jgi:hypothetical protein
MSSEVKQCILNTGCRQTCCNEVHFLSISNKVKLYSSVVLRAETVSDTNFWGISLTKYWMNRPVLGKVKILSDNKLYFKNLCHCFYEVNKLTHLFILFFFFFEYWLIETKTRAGGESRRDEAERFFRRQNYYVGSRSV